MNLFTEVLITHLMFSENIQWKQYRKHNIDWTWKTVCHILGKLLTKYKINNLNINWLIVKITILNSSCGGDSSSIRFNSNNSKSNAKYLVKWIGMPLKV